MRNFYIDCNGGVESRKVVYKLAPKLYEDLKLSDLSNDTRFYFWIKNGEVGWDYLYYPSLPKENPIDVLYMIDMEELNERLIIPKDRPDPEKIFLESIKKSITNLLIDNPNYENDYYFEYGDSRDIYKVIDDTKKRAKSILEDIDRWEHLVLMKDR